VQAAEFVLPHIFLVTLCEKNDNVTENIFKEVTAILEHCSSLKDTSEEKTALLCTQTLFTSLDYLEVWLHHDAATNAKEVNPKGTSSTKSILPSRNFITVQNFLDSISKELLAHAAYNCHAFARALKYFQQHLVKFSHSQIQPNLNFLQEIFVALSDIDGVRGVSSIRSQQPSLQEQILEYQSIGDFRSALGCYEIAIQEQPKIEYYEESLSCLMRLGEFDTAYAYAQSKGRLAEMSETSQVFTSYCVEAAWKLRNWDLLDRTLKEKSCRNTWGVGLGRLLLAAKTKDTLSFHKQLNSLRASLMGPIVASKVELGSYQRAYSHIIKLHMLQDCEDLVNVIFESTDQLNNKSITPILKQWRNRLLATQDSYTAQEPILNLHRVLLTLANDVTSDKNIINNEIGSLWLKSAGVARNSNHLEVAHNHLLNASSYMLPELYLEKAELIKNQGRPNEALLMLQKFVKENKDLTPLSSSTNAMALLMIGKLMEDTDQLSQAVLKHYKDIIEIDSENEEAHYRLGRYYDRLLPLVDKNPQNYGDVLQYIVKGYGDSLMYGNKFIYHCMPRALSLWLEYGVGRESVNTQSQLNKITTLMNTFVDRLPPYHFFIGFSQIISHICHQDPQIFTVLEKIILKLIEHFPQQSLWMMVAAIKSRNSTRKSRCKSILNKAKRQYPEKQRLVDDMIKLSGHLLDVCKHNPPSNKFKLKMDEICRELVRLTKSQQFTCILVPLQSSLTVTLPTSHESSHLYNPFPGSLPTIFKFDDNVDVLPSMQKPKKIVILASDGKRYTMLCKPKDDLRKDCRLMEFNSVINKFLLRDPECRQRHLHIRTYAVIPLSEDNGIVEWVDNTAGYRYILNKIYQEKGLYTSGAELKKFASIKDKAILKDVYVNQLLPKFPAVFGEWFMKTFSDPISWYSSIQSFSRTAAVMSIVGYIVGLGDRHGENILIDYVNGDVVHVDFSHLFNKGSTLQVPEIVPFRLTHNMVNAMGVTKYEGTFKISCEMTMRVMRDQKHPLLCILKTLIHDPLLEWTCESNRGQSSREEISERAVKIVKDVDEKLCGRTGKTLPLSVESHVQSLIMDATDIDNLSQMYIGWAPFM
jgi:serine/threonine-protein kinase ATR